MHSGARMLLGAAVILVADGVLAGWSLGTLASGCITAAALALMSSGLRPVSPGRHMASLAFLYWGLSYVSNLLEALAFKVIPIGGAIRSAVAGLVIAVCVASVLAFVPRNKEARRHAPEASPAFLQANLPWRFVLLSLAFVVIYLAAGIAFAPRLWVLRKPAAAVAASAACARRMPWPV